MKALWLVAGLGWSMAVWVAAADPAGAEPPDNPVADKLWSAIGADAGALTEAERTQNVAGMRSAVTQVRADVASFLQQFPADKHTPGARLMQAQSDQMALALELPEAPTKDEVVREFHAIATDSSLPDAVRVQASMVDAAQIFTSAMALAKDNPHDPTIWDNLEAKIDAFEKGAGDGPGQEPEQAVVMLRHNQIMLLQQAGETGRMQALLVQLVKSPHSEIASMAQQMQAKLASDVELKTRPLDLHFTALDGSPIDLAKLRGKVVLVDFWATWCGPCREETPDVVAAYQKYHARGLEIVGISLDRDKDALTKYIADNRMPWPQYFDGKGWDNAIAQRFGIDSIPAMWLVGKDGLVATQDGRTDLDGQIEKLLGTP